MFFRREELKIATPMYRPDSAVCDSRTNITTDKAADGFVESWDYNVQFPTADCVDLDNYFTCQNSPNERYRQTTNRKVNNLFMFLPVSNALLIARAVVRNLQVRSTSSRPLQPTSLDIGLSKARRTSKSTECQLSKRHQRVRTVRSWWRKSHIIGSGGVCRMQRLRMSLQFAQTGFEAQSASAVTALPSAPTGAPSGVRCITWMYKMRNRSPAWVMTVTYRRRMSNDYKVLRHLAVEYSIEWNLTEYVTRCRSFVILEVSETCNWQIWQIQIHVTTHVIVRLRLK